MPIQPSIALENGDFGPETYLQSSFDPSEIVQAGRGENLLVYGIGSDEKGEAVRQPKIMVLTMN